MLPTAVWYCGEGARNAAAIGCPEDRNSAVLVIAGGAGAGACAWAVGRWLRDGTRAQPLVGVGLYCSPTWSNSTPYGVLDKGAGNKIIRTPGRNLIPLVFLHI